MREAEGDWHTQRKRGRSREVESGRLKDWTAVATSQSQPTATRSWKRWRKPFPLAPPGGTWPSWHLDFSPVTSFQTSGLQNWERMSVLNRWVCGNLSQQPQEANRSPIITSYYLSARSGLVRPSGDASSGPTRPGSRPEGKSEHIAQSQ